MNKEVQSIVIKQVLAIGLAFAAVIAVALGIGAWLWSRSAPPPGRVPPAVVEQCRTAIRSQMNNPGTVKFLAGGVSTKVRSEGGNLVRLTFRASNSYGMESEMRGLCVFPAGGGIPSVTFTE